MIIKRSGRNEDDVVVYSENKSEGEIRNNKKRHGSYDFNES